jgi:large subunit ribosomal protein L21
MYAIIQSGGKQYRVSENSVVRLELLDAEVGSRVELNDVAMLGGGDVLVGQPLVTGARVLGKVVAHGRTRRIVVFKYKPKKGYHRRKGHRQHYHDVLIQQILAPGQEPRQAGKAAAPAAAVPAV